MCSWLSTYHWHIDIIIISYMTCRILSQKNFDKRLVTKMLKKKKSRCLVNKSWVVSGYHTSTSQLTGHWWLSSVSTCRKRNTETLSFFIYIQCVPFKYNRLCRHRWCLTTESIKCHSFLKNNQSLNKCKLFSSPLT